MSKTFDSRKLSYLRNYEDVALRAKEVIKSEDPEATVYVFGSVVEGKYTGSSDIDLLVVTKRKEELEYKIKIKVYKNMLDAPLEIHVASPDELAHWYSRFIRPEEMQII